MTTKEEEEQREREKLRVKHSQTKSCCDKENIKKETAAPSLPLSGLMKNENLFYSNHSSYTCAFVQKKKEYSGAPGEMTGTKEAHERKMISEINETNSVAIFFSCNH